jgi:hypothetical protein
MTETRKMEWRSAIGFPAYEVSECGDLRRASTRTRLRGQINADGYPEYSIQDASGKKRHISAHRLVIEAFVGPSPFDGMEIAHRDGSRLNSHKNNLRWTTRKSNSDDRIMHATTTAGERNGRAKITEKDVVDIRREYRLIKRRGSGRTVSELDRKYGLDRSTIINIAKGVSWAHVPMPLTDEVSP